MEKRVPFQLSFTGNTSQAEREKVVRDMNYISQSFIALLQWNAFVAEANRPPKKTIASNEEWQYKFRVMVYEWISKGYALHYAISRASDSLEREYEFGSSHSARRTTYRRWKHNLKQHTETLEVLCVMLLPKRKGLLPIELIRMLRDYLF